jgi:hypothetical protein
VNLKIGIMALGIAGWSCSLPLGAQEHGTPPPAQAPAPAAPQSPAVPAPAAVPAEPVLQLVDAPGRDVVLIVCAACHDPVSRITKYRLSVDGWADLITDMQNRGMQADDADVDVVLDYLSKNYGCGHEQQSGPCEPDKSQPAKPVSSAHSRQDVVASLLAGRKAGA